MITQLCNFSGGSKLLPALMHRQLNTPSIPNLEPYNTVVFAVADAVIVRINRNTIFDRTSGEKRVIPGEAFSS